MDSNTLNFKIINLNNQLNENFPSYEISLEGSAPEYMVSIFISGVEVWQVDTRISPILKAETTNEAIEAVRNAIEKSDNNKQIDDMCEINSLNEVAETKDV